MTKSLKGGVHYITENAATGVVGDRSGAIRDAGAVPATAGLAAHVRNVRQGYDIGINIGSRLRQAGSGRWQLSASGALPNGTFAYQPTREFIMMGYSSKVNGSNNAILSFGHSDYARRAIHYNERDTSANVPVMLRNGHWHVMSGAFVVNGSIVIPSGNIVTFANDEAARVSRAAPGEFAYMYGNPLPRQDDYDAKTG